MKEVFAVDFRQKREWEAISVKKQNGRYIVSSVEKFQEASSEAENFIRRNAGRTIALFPFEATYCHEVRISKKLSRKSLLAILKASTEAALPIHLKGQFHFDLPINQSGKEEHRLQLIADLPQDAFQSFYELEMMELQPAAFFEGFSRLFALPQDQKYCLYYQAAQFELFVIGNGWKIEKMRIIKKNNAYQFKEVITSFLKGTGVTRLYSWCGETETKELSGLAFPEFPLIEWTHLKGGRMAPEIQPYKDKIEWICHAVAFLEGFINPCSRISPPRFSFLHGKLAKAGSRMFVIGTALLGIVLLYSCIRLRMQWQREDFLYRSISEKFYSFFSPQTPLINPVQQISELFQTHEQEDGSFADIPDSGIFLQSLSAFFKNKSQDQTVTQIRQKGNLVYIEGLYGTRDKLNKWSASLNGLKFSGLKIRTVKVEWPLDKHYRVSFEYEKENL